MCIRYNIKMPSGLIGYLVSSVHLTDSLSFTSENSHSPGIHARVYADVYYIYGYHPFECIILEGIYRTWKRRQLQKWKKNYPAHVSHDQTRPRR